MRHRIGRARSITVAALSTQRFVKRGPLTPGVRDGRLYVTCWCERHVVHVLLNDIANGRTLSCGRLDCLGPKGFTNA